MKNLSLIGLLLLSACGQSSGGATQEATNPFANQGGVPIQVTPVCNIPIVGLFQNLSDGIIATVAERNGGCGVQLSCGFRGYIFDQGGNQYTMIASTSEGDTIGGCGLPNQSTNFSGKSGTYFQLTFGNYGGTWQGGFMPSETNNVWSKI